MDELNIKGLLIEEYKKREEKEDKSGTILILAGTKHCFLTKAIQHGPEGEILDVVAETLEILEIPGNITVKGQIKVSNATNVNKLAILLRTVHSIESMVTQALQNMIASSKMMI